MTILMTDCFSNRPLVAGPLAACSPVIAALLRGAVSVALVLAVISAVGTERAVAEDRVTSSGLVTLSRQLAQGDAAANRTREQLFKLAFAEQKRLLTESEQRLAAAERRQEELKAAFDANEEQLTELETVLAQRTGTLGEVFGVAKENARELVPMLLDSMTGANYPDRAQILEFAESKRIPTLNELQLLLEQLNLELEATGQSVQFPVAVIAADGRKVAQNVRRFGVFSAVNDRGEYLLWDIQQQALRVLNTQPHKTFDAAAGDDARSVQVLIDPSRGELFALLDRLPKLSERIQQGGTVGYLIIILGILGVIVALVQLARIVLMNSKVRQQLNQPGQLSANNPLGRVLLAMQGQMAANSGQEYRDLSLAEQHNLERCADEAILQELPKLEWGQSLVKLLAAVAPLLGLLGTVIGMILTFQSITLFGTSDPKLMANGISQALTTTVLGLIVAIPLLFAHSTLVAQAKRLVQVLQEKSLAALVASVERYSTTDRPTSSSTDKSTNNSTNNCTNKTTDNHGDRG